MQCTPKVSSDIEKIMNDAELNEVFLFGGAVLDPLTQENAKINDYDLCVKDQDVFYASLKKLEEKNCSVSDVIRTHDIYSVIKHPEVGEIDFSFMKDPEVNGIFNIEKIYAKFRRTPNGIENTVVDKYGAIEGIQNRRIRLACTPEEEGAYNVLRRFLAIVGKYNLDVSKGGPNQETIDQIKEGLKNASHTIPQDKVRCLSRIPASLKRSQDRYSYVKNLGEQGIFETAYPEIHRLFNNPEFVNDEKLAQCETQKDLLWLMVKNTKKTEERDTLVDCLRELSKREAARQDKGVKSFVDEIENEKTSSSRLTKQIINPLFAYIVSKKQQNNN